MHIRAEDPAPGIKPIAYRCERRFDRTNRQPAESQNALKMAEKSGSRTHQGRLTPPTGFEDRAPHQGAILFPKGNQKVTFISLE